jgi:hypothetical protein
MQRDLQVDLGRYQDNKRAQCVRNTLGLEMGLEKCCAQNFAVRSIAPQREAPTAASSWVKLCLEILKLKPRQTNDVLVIYHSSRIAHVLRDSASSRGLFQVATEFETS